MKLYWHKTNNFGDAIAPIILAHFTGEDAEFADRHIEGKWVSTGSIMYAVRERDVVFGTGLISKPAEPVEMTKATFLAVRGPETRKNIIGDVPEIYGDPGILLPLIYNPSIEKKHKLGIIPHYADRKTYIHQPGGHRIDIQAHWKKVIEEILSCETIMSSSLHGIIAAEAYGIPAIWAKWSENIIGGEFKFQDYFLGTRRGRQKPFEPIEPMSTLDVLRQRGDLIKALRSHHERN
jgi:pyruvyltransferase